MSIIFLLPLFALLISCVKEKPPVVPTEIPEVQTLGVTSVTANSAVCTGKVTEKPGSVVDQRGICWNTTGSPTYDDSRTINGEGAGSFSAIIDGLSQNTIYHVRAYASNMLGIGYGNEVFFKTPVLINVGDSYQGGIVAYILKNGDPGYNPDIPHGLIIAPASATLGGSIWYNGRIMNTGANGGVIGTGYSNTISIVSSQGNGSYAARRCYDLVYGGYDDWFLPSSEELAVIFANKNLLGGFGDGYYWTSTEIAEVNPALANVLQISLTEVKSLWMYKSYALTVRAVRYF